MVRHVDGGAQLDIQGEARSEGQLRIWERADLYMSFESLVAIGSAAVPAGSAGYHWSSRGYQERIGWGMVFVGRRNS
jgi:hypothetical protein